MSIELVPTKLVHMWKYVCIQFFLLTWWNVWQDCRINLPKILILYKYKQFGPRRAMSWVWKWQIYIIFSIYGANTMSHPNIVLYKSQTFHQNIFVWLFCRTDLLPSFIETSITQISLYNTRLNMVLYYYTFIWLQIVYALLISAIYPWNFRITCKKGKL